MEDGDEEDYAAFSKQMRDAAREIISAAKIDNYDQARKAVGAIFERRDDSPPKQPKAKIVT